MNIDKDELQKEQEYLNKTLDVVNELIEENDELIQGKQNEIQEMKKYIWDNNGVLDDVEVKLEMYNINRSVLNTNDTIKQLLKLKKSLISPYFGRVDFEEDGFKDTVYIGINGIMKDLEFYVFDWRAPISSLFYNYGVGPASYSAPNGKISGDVTLKRQYKINGNTIERCFDSDLNIDDDYLQEILANSSSEKMTNIVNTIQKEQNEIIRNITDKYLVVQGIAGSGKTSVALHRIAYLLYKEKDLKSNNVLIFSPNEVFSQYISNVLPELGEDNVLQTTYSDFAYAFMKDVKKIESFTEFIERYYKNNDMSEDEYKITKFKLSDKFKELIDKYITDCKKNISFIKPMVINGKIFSVEELNKLFKETYDKFPLTERIYVLADHLCDLTKISYKKNEKLLEYKIRENLNYNLDFKKIYKDIIKSDDFKKLTDSRENITFNLGKVLKYEDLIPLMYINFEVNGYPKNNRIRHVIIDEAQDYSLVQFEMLKKIFNDSSFTILGDINQTINPYYKYESLNNVNGIFNNKVRYLELNKTYRSSEEIINYTNEILGLSNACAVRHSNNIPVKACTVSIGEVAEHIVKDIETMRQNGIKRIAIITKNSSETLSLYEVLKDYVTDISVIDKSTNNKVGETVIMPSYISKGLEFDGVISYTDEKNPYTEKDKYLFYVVCTRAQHSLTVYNQKELKLERKK